MRYTDGYSEITREEFLALQDRLCAGDPVAWGRVVINQHRAEIEAAAKEDDES